MLFIGRMEMDICQESWDVCRILIINVHLA